MFFYLGTLSSRLISCPSFGASMYLLIFFIFVIRFLRLRFVLRASSLLYEIRFFALGLKVINSILYLLIFYVYKMLYLGIACDVVNTTAYPCSICKHKLIVCQVYSTKKGVKVSEE